MTVEFTLAEYRVKEDGTWLTERPSIIRTGGTESCSVKVSNTSSSTIEGRGTRDKDYLAPASTIVSFANGETGIKYIDFVINQDNLDEQDEFVPLSLSLVSGIETLGAIKSSRVTIFDDDETIPPPPTLIKQVSSLGLRQENLGGFGLNNRYHNYLDVNTNLPANLEVPEGSNLASFIKEITLPPNLTNFPVRQIRCWANGNYYLFIDNSIRSFIRPLTNKIIVCPTMALSGNVNQIQTYDFKIGYNQRIWIATQIPNTIMRFYFSIEDYSSYWLVESGFNIDVDGSVDLFPVLTD